MAQPRVILVVEDEVNCRETLGEILQYEGYHVAYATTGQEALHLLRTGLSPEVILLDLRMPVMDGWQFRAHQKRDPTLAAIPVVVTTGTPVTVGEALALEADDFFTKPYRVSQLLATLGHYSR